MRQVDKPEQFEPLGAPIRPESQPAAPQQVTDRIMRNHDGSLYTAGGGIDYLFTSQDWAKTVMSK